MAKSFNLKSFIIATLRRASYRWIPRNECRLKARTGRNQYTCAYCKGTFTRKDTKVDHIQPVIDPTKGWTTYEDFIERLFCAAEGFQVLCDNHHKEKTLLENATRKETRKK